MKHICTLLFFLLMIFVVDAAKQKEIDLFNAAAQGNLKKFQELIAHGTDVNVKHKEGLTALHVAQDPNIIHELIIANANVNAVAKDGSTPLLTALYQNNKIKAIYLLDAGALVNVKQTLQKGNDYTPLRSAAEKKDYEMVFALLKQEARISNFLLSHLKRLKDLDSEYADIVHLLELYKEFKKKSCLNAFDKDGLAEIHKAVLLNDPIKIDALVIVGASLNILNKAGQAPLHIAINQSYKNCFEKLIDLGADVNKLDYQGNTPLDLAYRNNNSLFIELLSRRGGIIQSLTNCQVQNFILQNSFQQLTTNLERLNQQLSLLIKNITMR